MSKIHIFSHNDLDGVSPSLLLREAFGEQVGLTVFCSYQSINKSVLKFLRQNKRLSDVLYITDLTVNEEVAEMLNERYINGQKIVLLDHHSTNLHMNKYEWANVRIEESERETCATELMYLHLLEEGSIERSERFDTFVELVRSYDTWDWYRSGCLKAKELNDFFFMLPIKESIPVLMSILEEGKETPFEFPEKYKYLLEVERMRISKYSHRKGNEARVVRIGEHSVCVVYAEHYHSELGAYLGEKFDTVDYVQIIDFSSRKVSLRTNREDVDVEAIAKGYGGGGHKKSSGFVLPKENFQQFLLYD